MISQGACAFLYTHLYYSTYKTYVSRGFITDIHVFQYGKSLVKRKDKDNNRTAHDIVQMDIMQINVKCKRFK
jgi:hypothetical protein